MLVIFFQFQCVNSLWPNDTISWHSFSSKLVQAMACCLKAPSHYLNQCWLISKLQWYSSEGHHSDVIMGSIASQITSLTIAYSTVYSDADQRKHQSSTSLAFVRGIHQGLVNSLHKWPVTWKMFPFDDVIMQFHQRYLGHQSLKWASKLLI